MLENSRYHTFYSSRNLPNVSFITFNRDRNFLHVSDVWFCCFFEVSDNHFFYFFAPSNNEPICKHMVLVIDVSGSMWGVKMKQVNINCLPLFSLKVSYSAYAHLMHTLQNTALMWSFSRMHAILKLLLQMVAALKAILDDLTVKDYFSIIDFNHNVRCWSEDLVPASSINVADAKKYIEDIKPNGGTSEKRSTSMNSLSINDQFLIFSGFV